MRAVDRGERATTRRSAGPHTPGRQAAGRSERRRFVEPGTSAAAAKCRRKFLRFFPGGFRDETYIDWERGYKETAHTRWKELFSLPDLVRLARSGRHTEIAAEAVRIESRTNLLFSFEKMAVREGLRNAADARAFVRGLIQLLERPGIDEERFHRWIDAVASLPRRKGGTRVLTWPIVTVFPFIADPDRHIFLKPTVTKLAARQYGFNFSYHSRPAWPVYLDLLRFARTIRRDLSPFTTLRPRDMIDIQSFIWVQGSDEYEEGGKHGTPAPA